MVALSRGWLEYGDDAGLVFRHSLKTPITNGQQAAGWSNMAYRGSGLSPTHDRELGMIGLDINGAEAAYRFDGTTSLAKKLSVGGQISVELERDWVCANASGDGSIGYAPAVTEGALTLLSNNGSSDFGVKSSNGLNAWPGSFAYHDFVRGSAVDNQIHSHGKGDFVRVNMGWWGPINGGGNGLGITAFDGLVTAGWGWGQVAATDLFAWLYIGNKRDNVGSYLKRRMRNLQISHVPPVFGLPPLLSSVVMLGDSTMDASGINGGQRDCAAQYAFRRVFHQAGIRPVVAMVSENGGYRVSLPMQIETVVPTVLTVNPSLICIVAGTNDVGDVGYNSAAFLAEYKDLIEQLMFGVTKTSRTTARMIQISTPLPRSDCLSDPVKAARHADVRAHIASLPVWWDATYGPQYGTGRVVVADVFSEIALGHGWAADPSMSTDGVHPAYAANRLMGMKMAQVVMPYISGF